MAPASPAWRASPAASAKFGMVQWGAAGLGSGGGPTGLVISNSLFEPMTWTVTCWA
ncbi:hypothetical protein P4132_05160 [Pseudomonas aeruginosa]|nr:hypothetical protein [Pseudomonas aeruginosa]